MISALYLHIPFCTSRCAYCAFPTAACHDAAAMDAYVDALSLQLRRAAKAGLLGGVRTIYIGGGTPTHLGSRRLNSLVYLVSLSVNLENVREFTVEANPESLTPQLVRDLYALGVSRLSIGAQSFDDTVLRSFGRPHSSADIERAVGAAQEREISWSLDLICGGPGQSMESWCSSVQRAVELGARHVSIYPLALEEGTPLAMQVEAGEWEGPSEDEEAAMMEAAEQLLQAAGLQRYEVASYALPGCESLHNQAYWDGSEYLGLGAGAASMLGAQSWRAASQAGIFGEVQDASGLAEGAEQALRVLDAEPSPCSRVRVQALFDTPAFSAGLGRPAVELELMDSRQALLEDCMLAFRRSAGLQPELCQRAATLEPQLEGVLAELQREGLVQPGADGSLQPTERGWLMGNRIFGDIWGLA
ncbi:MAG: radical SAM family heme chaperone HemW [Coriobacteriales bacterium]